MQISAQTQWSVITRPMQKRTLHRNQRYRVPSFDQGRLAGWLFVCVGLAVRIGRVLVRGGGVFVRLGGVLSGYGVIARLMVLGRFMVRLGCMLVVCGCLLVCFVCHDISFVSDMTSAIPFDDPTPPTPRRTCTPEDKLDNFRSRSTASEHVF
jgi:hypothetical protein